MKTFSMQDQVEDADYTQISEIIGDLWEAFALRTLRLKAKNVRDIKNDTEFFRKLGQNGIISFNEYLFLLCIITKPRQGFEVAFKMFDTGKDFTYLAYDS